MSYYAKGQHEAICDRCGFKYKSGQLKKEWTGFYVCRDCFETRHPQDFAKGIKDDPSVEWTRPEGTDVEVDNTSWTGRTDVPSGTNDNGL